MLWSWSQVSACEELSRAGLDPFGLSSSRFAVRPLTLGVSDFAWNVVPSVFAAFG